MLEDATERCAPHHDTRPRCMRSKRFLTPFRGTFSMRSKRLLTPGLHPWCETRNQGRVGLGDDRGRCAAAPVIARSASNSAGER